MTQTQQRIARYLGLVLAALLLAPGVPGGGKAPASAATLQLVEELPCFGGLGNYELSVYWFSGNATPNAITLAHAQRESSPAGPASRLAPCSPGAR